MVVHRLVACQLRLVRVGLRCRPMPDQVLIVQPLPDRMAITTTASGR